MEIEDPLSRFALFNLFNQEERKSILHKSRTIVCRKGDFLFHKNDHATALYILLHGEMKEIHEDHGGSCSFWIDISDQTLVGEWELITNNPWCFGLLARTDSELRKIERSYIEEILVGDQERIHLLWKQVIRSLEHHQLAKILPKYFGTLTGVDLTEIEKNLDWIELKKGDILTHGEDNRGFFFILIGHLRSINDKSGKGCDFKSGDCFGFSSLFQSSFCSTHYEAMRESYLVCLREKSFEELLTLHPSFTKAIIHSSKEGHLLAKDRYEGERQVATNILLLPLHDTLDRRRLGRLFYDSFLHEERVTYIDRRRVERELHLDFIKGQSFLDYDKLKLFAWIDELECEYDRLLFLGSTKWDMWNSLLLQTSDIVVKMGDERASPALTPLEESMKREGCSPYQYHYLVLLHRREKMSEGVALPWLQQRELEQHFHLNSQSLKDFDRIARSLLGNGYGLVLSGGGGKTVAHYGVIRAFEELAVPIDYIGGTSAGGAIAAGYALDGCHTLNKEALGLIHGSLKTTIPMLSLYNGKVMYDTLIKIFGDNKLEDLSIPTFTLSYDCSNRRSHIHQRGLIRDAIYASGALPGLLPPFCEQGRCFIDGGVIDNLPIEPMHHFCRGGRVIASRIISSSSDKILFLKEGIPLNREVLWDYLSWKVRKESSAPLLPELLYSGFLGANNFLHQRRLERGLHDLEIIIDLGNTKLFEFIEFEKKVKLGYEAAMKVLPAFLERESQRP